MAESNQTGVFFFNAGPLPTLKQFPREYRRSLSSRFEPRFLAIFFSILIVVSSVFLYFSQKNYDTHTVSNAQVQKIQERYAQLVLNQPKPKVEVPTEVVSEKKTVAEGPATTTAETPTEEKTAVEPEKETYVQKQERKEATKETRAAARAQVQAQIKTAGIFAAITASSGGGSGGSGLSEASDMLGGAGDAIGDISNIKVTKNSFATKTIESTDLSARRGAATGTKDVDIARQEIGKAQVTKIAANTAVNISSSTADISVDESAGASPDRSASSIVRIISREKTRLIRVYENWLKRDPSLAGQIRIKFVILPNGSVSSVVVVKSTTNNAEFDQMILRYVARWTFPAIADGGAMVPVEFPLVFEGQSSN